MLWPLPRESFLLIELYTLQEVTQRSYRVDGNHKKSVSISISVLFRFQYFFLVSWISYCEGFDTIQRNIYRYCNNFVCFKLLLLIVSSTIAPNIRSPNGTNDRKNFMVNFNRVKKIANVSILLENKKKTTASQETDIRSRRTHWLWHVMLPMYSAWSWCDGKPRIQEKNEIFRWDFDFRILHMYNLDYLQSRFQRPLHLSSILSHHSFLRVRFHNPVNYESVNYTRPHCERLNSFHGPERVCRSSFSFTL